jgi:polyphosphate kinase 2 (PPK2 family)
LISGQRDRAADATLERLADQLGLSIRYKKNGKAALAGPDGDAVQTWREDYPYVTKLRRRQYEKSKRLLQIEMLKLQRSIRGQQGRLVILFEGRDAAGKGGTIKRFTENLNPRGTGRPSASRPSGTCSVTYLTCPQRARSRCSTGPGTTARASSG